MRSCVRVPLPYHDAHLKLSLAWFSRCTTLFLVYHQCVCRYIARLILYFFCPSYRLVADSHPVVRVAASKTPVKKLQNTFLASRTGDLVNRLASDVLLVQGSVTSSAAQVNNPAIHVLVKENPNSVGKKIVVVFSSCFAYFIQLRGARSVER